MPDNQLYIPSNVNRVTDREGLVWEALRSLGGPDAVIWDCDRWHGDAFQSTSQFIADRGPVSW